MKKIKNFFRSAWGARLIALYLKFVYKTTRWTFENETLFKVLEGQPRLFCFWHGRLAMMPFAWRSKETFYMLLSKHRDGKFIGDILLKCGPFELIYGSTNRGGAQAAVHVVRHLQKGHPVGITPDGPRGPKEVVSEGTAVLAYLSQAVVVPATFSIKRCFYLKSWDHFCVPLPFSKGHFVVGAPLSPPIHREEFASWKESLTRQLKGLLS